MNPKRILIVNRGEIAIRIAKGIKELGHIACGLWTDAEPNAPHLEYCDEWIYLKGTSNTETFLNIPSILRIIEEHNIEAVHPGYGFLSENAKFVQELEKKKIIFIGPHAEAIELMGDKGVAKLSAEKAGVPVVPGSKGELKSGDQGVKVSKEIGYPVLLKAVAGGGGKGMRICNSDEEVIKNFEIVKREALSSFGNEGVIVEKYIQNPRHIEVQVLGDQKGNVVHFFERECSIQRRHQKIIEEAPSPFIGDDEELREELCSTAVRLAKAVNYNSAGTVEFIMGSDKKFYFLEMNTRIQVEHPITEEITGIDLIVLMIQSAFGQDLEIPNQSFIKKYGHSIECRICAEDPVTMLPSPGKVVGLEWTFPQSVRFDHCLYKGLEITPDFDPMVGKLVVKGINRGVAIRKMKSAVKGLVIEGIKTNRALLLEILDHKDFHDGNYSTHFIDQQKPQEKIHKKLEHEALIRKIAVIEAQEMMDYL